MPDITVSRVQLFATCLVDHFHPRVAEATISVLERLGLEVEVPLDQTCCGQPAFNGGFHREATAMARHTLDVLSRSDAPVVVPSGSCAEMIVHRYPDLLAGEPAYREKARALAARTFELSQFLVDVLGTTRLGAAGSGCIAYHASCHGLRGLGIHRQPLALLDGMNGIEHRRLPDATNCCGFGGLFAIKMAAISGAMLDEKLDAVHASGASVVVATDVSCLMHIAGGLRRRRSAVRTMHLAEVLAGDTAPGEADAACAGPDAPAERNAGP
jgi:L-lactate dehydrogenase complex protein LldE